MTIKEITKKFIDNPNRMRPGVTSLAKRFKCTKETIYEARKEARAIIKGGKEDLSEGSKKIPEIRDGFIILQKGETPEDYMDYDPSGPRTFLQKLCSLLLLGKWK